MRKILLVFMIIFILSQPLFGEEYDCTENSIGIYLAGAKPEYWGYPESIPENAEPLHFPMESTFVFGGGFDFGWGIAESVDMLIGFNQFLRAPCGEVWNKGEEQYEKGPESLAFSPIYMNVRYKTPFQLYAGCGLNWSVIRITDGGTSYAASGGFGVQGFGGIEMRGTTRASRSFCVFGEIGYCVMSGFTNVLDGSSLVKIIQKDAGLYGRIGVRKYL